MAALLDTCVIIDLLRDNARARQSVASLDERPCFCAASEMELIAGVRSQREEQSIERLLGLFLRVSIEPAIFRLAGTYLRHFQPSHGLDIPDALIAAVAEHHGLSLLTLNVKHFPMIEGLRKAY